MKKIVILGIVIVMTGVIGLVVTRLARQAAVSEPEEVAKVRMLSPVFSDDGQAILYFDRTTNQFSRFDLASNESTPIDESEFLFVNRVAWSPDRSEVVIRVSNTQPAQLENPLYLTDVPEGQFVSWRYNFTSGEKARLPGNPGEAVWSPSGATLYYEFQRGDTYLLSASNPDGSNWVNLSPLEAPDIRLTISPGGKTLAYSEPKTTTFDIARRDKKTVSDFASRALVWRDETTLLAAQTVRRSKDELVDFIVSVGTASQQQKTISSGLPGESVLDLFLAPGSNTLFFTSADTLYRVDLP